MFKSLGVPELILILVIIFIFFGVGKLPQVGDALGKAVRAFRQGQKDEPVKAETEPAAAESAKTTTVARKTTTRKTSDKKTA